MKKKTVATLVGGMAAGAALGVLLAPKSGKETRADLMAAFDDFMKKVKDIDSDDVKKYVDKNIKKIKKDGNYIFPAPFSCRRFCQYGRRERILR